MTGRHATPLLPETRRALEAYARECGANWKLRLRDAWRTGTAPPALLPLRALGPLGLMRLRLDEPAVSSITEAVVSVDRTALAALLAMGAAPDSERNPEGETPLHLACYKDRVDILPLIALLLDHGADPNARALDRATPVHYAVAAGNLAACRMLLSRGAHPSSAAERGITPLHFAAAHGRHLIARALIDAGADPMARMMSGETAVDVAHSEGHSALAQLMSTEAAKSAASAPPRLLSVR
jgi:hypothetical protein